MHSMVQQAVPRQQQINKNKISCHSSISLSAELYGHCNMINAAFPLHKQML